MKSKAEYQKLTPAQRKVADDRVASFLAVSRGGHTPEGKWASIADIYRSVRAGDLA